MARADEILATVRRARANGLDRETVLKVARHGSLLIRSPRDRERFLAPYLRAVDEVYGKLSEVRA